MDREEWLYSFTTYPHSVPNGWDISGKDDYDKYVELRR